MRAYRRERGQDALYLLRCLGSARSEPRGRRPGAPRDAHATLIARRGSAPRPAFDPRRNPRRELAPRAPAQGREASRTCPRAWHRKRGRFDGAVCGCGLGLPRARCARGGRFGGGAGAARVRARRRGSSGAGPVASRARQSGGGDGDAAGSAGGGSGGAGDRGSVDQPAAVGSVPGSALAVGREGRPPGRAGSGERAADGPGQPAPGSGGNGGGGCAGFAAASPGLAEGGARGCRRGCGRSGGSSARSSRRWRRG